jgi:hypothetical protein
VLVSPHSRFAARDARVLRVSVSGFLDMLSVVVRTLRDNAVTVA